MKDCPAPTFTAGAAAGNENPESKSEVGPQLRAPGKPTQNDTLTKPAVPSVMVAVFSAAEV
jgi:hypothetical protein